MGTVPIVIFLGLRQTHPQGHGELGPPHAHFPGYTPAWCNPKLEHLYFIPIARHWEIPMLNIFKG